MQGTLFAKLCANKRLYEATESGWMSVSVGKREWFSFGRTEELTMIVEERGIPVWTRVRFPPGPLLKNTVILDSEMKFTITVFLYKRNIFIRLVNDLQCVLIVIQYQKGVMNMAQTMVNFRIDEDVKRKMESACKEMGLSLSTAFNIFAIKVGNERRIPFEVAADSFYSESNMSVLEERAANIESGKSIPKEHELIEV